MSGSQTIMRYSQDITHAEAPPPLPARSYPAEIIGASLRPAQSSGLLYWNLLFRVNADDYPADFVGGDPDGTQIYYNRVRGDDSPVGRYATRRLMEKIGGPLAQEIDANSLIGLRATIEVNHQEYEGEQRANIARVLAP